MKKRENLSVLSAIYIYNEGLKDINFKGLERFIKNHFGKIRIKVIHRSRGRLNVPYSLVETKGLLFDPIKTKEAFDRIAVEDRSACHIILTDKLLATFDEDKRLHIRAAVYGFPSIISSSGIVEGPAKPREYYIYKDRFTKFGVWPIEEPKIKKRFKNRFIDYGDRRINEVLKGYVSQALFFHITGNPFCGRRSCRLFNAHWQEDLIYSQVKIGKFCRAHQRILKNFKKPRIYPTLH